MGLLEPYVGYRSCHGETRLNRFGKAVTFLNLDQAEAALQAAQSLDTRVTLLSAPDAAASVGPGWFDAVVALASQRVPEAEFDAVLDCGAAAGDALAALRHGVKVIRYSGANQVAISEIAEQQGAFVLQERPVSLDLSDAAQAGQDLATACREWLSG